MSISSINGQSIDEISAVNNVSKATIDKINSVDAAAGFAVNYSIDFNGSNQYANFGNLANTSVQPTQATMNTNGYTLSAWVYVDSLTSGECVINVGSSGTNNYYGLKIFINGNGAFVFHVFGLNQGFAGAGSNNRNTIRTANSAISAGQWYHLAVVVPAGSMGSTQERDEWRLYKNGSVVNPSSYVKSGNQNVQLTYTGNTSVGAWTRNSNQTFFDGEINNQAVFDSELNASNIAAIYNSGSPLDLSTNSGNYTKSGSLAAWWRYNEGTGTSYTDSSGNGRTGAGVNSPTWSSNVPT